MKRERKKPEETFIERTRQELENEKITLGKQAYELGRIRGRKETIDKACEWLHSIIGDGFVRYGGERRVADNDQFVAMFRKAMEESK